jgi:hypothetical protein
MKAIHHEASVTRVAFKRQVAEEFKRRHAVEIG